MKLSLILLSIYFRDSDASAYFPLADWFALWDGTTFIATYFRNSPKLCVITVSFGSKEHPSENKMEEPDEWRTVRRIFTMLVHNPQNIQPHHKDVLIELRAAHQGNVDLLGEIEVCYPDPCLFTAVTLVYKR